MTTATANGEMTTQAQPYEHILSLIAQLTRNERLRLIMYICDTMLARLNEDDEDELARDADEVLANMPEDGWIPWEDVQAELMLMDDEELSLYEHTLIAVEQFTPMQWLHLVAYIARTIEPLLDEDSEHLIRESAESLEYNIQPHSPIFTSLEDSETERCRAEVMVELSY